MGSMPRYVHPPNLPPDEELAAAFDVLGTAFARGIVRYIAAKPGARIPALATYFKKYNATVRGVVVNLEGVGILKMIPGSERKIGAGYSHAYTVDVDRIREVMRAQEAYLLNQGPKTTPRKTANKNGAEGAHD